MSAARESRAKTILRWVLIVFMVLAGINHFISPAAYLAMMPVELPAPGALVAISGVAEILGGLGLILPQTRRLAAWGLLALYVAIFPANFNMAWNHLSLGGTPVPQILLWLRLPLQLVLMVWAAWVGGLRDARPPTPERTPAPRPTSPPAA